MGSIRQAVIIMAKQPQAGQAKTRLCPPLTPKQAAELAEAFLQDTVANALRADCAETVLAYAPSEAVAWFAAQFPGLARIPQQGRDLGQRLAAAFDSAWRLGCQPCLAIGADSPDLPVEYLRSACEALRASPESADVVLGPAEDGGYYLIGLQRRQPRLFEAIDWSTERVLAQTLERAAALGLRVHLLPPWRDRDTAADLDHLRVHLQTAPADVCPATCRLLATLP